MIRRAFPQQAVRTAAGKQEFNLYFFIYRYEQKMDVCGSHRRSLAVGSGATYLITKNSRSVQPQERVVEKVVEIEKSPAAHFTAYQAADYPDLTYAAENAVNAVVNIEVTQQVQMRNVDPSSNFSEYRRVTPAAGSMCLANSRRAVRRHHLAGRLYRYQPSCRG